MIVSSRAVRVVWQAGLVIDAVPTDGSLEMKCMKPRKPIFYDEQRRRWRRTSRILEISGALFTLLAITFLVNVLVSPRLPVPLLPTNRTALHPVREKTRTQDHAEADRAATPRRIARPDARRVRSRARRILRQLGPHVSRGACSSISATSTCSSPSACTRSPQPAAWMWRPIPNSRRGSKRCSSKLRRSKFPRCRC